MQNYALWKGKNQISKNNIFHQSLIVKFHKYPNREPNNYYGFKKLIWMKDRML
jgi:hypothetical protein